MNIQLATTRLIIKTPTSTDLNNLYTLLSNPQVMRFKGHGVCNQTQVQALLDKMIVHYQKHAFSLGCVYQK